MKKALTLLLTAAMLLTMLSVFAVTSVSAEETAAPARTPLKVTLVSGTKNAQHDSLDKTQFGEYADWTPTFDITNTKRNFVRTTTDIEVVGKFEQPTPVTSVVFNQNWGPYRLNGLNVQFSTDGANWTVGYTLQADEKSYGKNGCLIEVPTPGDDTAYSYVRFHMAAAMNSANYIEMDILWAAFYYEPAKADQLIEASLLKVTAPQGGFSNAESFFDFSNYTTISQNTGNVYPCDMVEGKFDHPTVLSDVYVNFKDASMNSTIIKASVDGVNWNTIVTMQGIWNNCQNKAAKKTAHFRVNDDTAYNYIQIVRNHKFWGGGFQAYSIGFVGEEQNVSNSVKYQTKVDGDAWALRLISTIDTLDCDAVGFEITATAAELTEAKAWDRNTDIVYTSITETVNGKDEIRDAAYCGGNYIYTAAITGISIADYSAITFTVKPYVLIDGAKVYGATQTIVLNDGVAA